MSIPLFSDGTWTTCEHPVPDSDWDDYDTWMSDGGYGRAQDLFNYEGSAVQLTIWAWQPGAKRPDGQPAYLVDVEFGSGAAIETVAAGTIVDAMALLSMWAPALQVGDASNEALFRAWQRDRASSRP